MSFPDRLSSLGGGKDDHHQSMAARRERDKDAEPPDASAAGLVQRCVIIQRDEKGYGFTVTGDNPVFVASVKPDGAASRAGVQNNDRIVKVNGTLVTSRNHLDVVKLIKSGSYVALTLLGKPQTSAPATPPIANQSVVNTATNANTSGIVTAPQPVNADKDRELAQHKIHMTKTMYETAVEDYTKLEKQFTRNPSEKLQNQLQEKRKTVDALGSRLQHLNADGHSHPTTPTSLISNNRYSDPHGNFEHFAGQSWSHRRTPSNPFTSSSSSPSTQQQHQQSIKHAKQKSVPALVGRSSSGDHFNPEMRGAAGSAAVARSKSDAAVRKNKTGSIFYVANQAPAADMSEASSLPSATSDLSMSDSPHTSPSISPTPNDAMMSVAAHRHNGQDTEESNLNSMMRQEIIHDEDEDMGSDDVQFQEVGPGVVGRSMSPPYFVANIIGPEANDPGPFVDIKSLESKPAHMAVVLKYLISNLDPSPVLFYIISNAYSRCSANVKELRKWAYEIYSVFLAQGCPLNIGLDDKENLITQMDSILTTAASRTDNESALRSMFDSAHTCIQSVIADYLTDFRNKKDLGMANFYGFDKLQDNMDKTAAGKVAEEILSSYLESVAVGPDEINSTVNDKDMATGWALATFLRLNGVGVSSKSSHSPVWDRISSFMMKDKKFKLPVSRSSKAKNVKGHQFTNQHFYVTTICNRCGYLIWGVGYQGFQCQSCEMTVHKHCMDDVTEMCGGKKKRGRFPVPRKPSTISQTSVISNQSQGSNTTDTSSLGSYQDHSGGGGPITQPIPKDDDPDLATTLLIIAGIPTGHSVKSIAKRYEANSPLDPSSPMTTSTTSSGGFEGLDIPSGHTGTPGSVGNGVRQGSSDLNRSGSLNNKGEKGGDRRARRAKRFLNTSTPSTEWFEGLDMPDGHLVSPGFVGNWVGDVEMDSETFKAINQSGSSSTSSMSNRSGESLSTSTDNVHEQEELDRDVEPELPPLKQVLGEDVLRKLKPKEKKRQEVINELMYTERAHLRNLRVLDKIFNQPMRVDIDMTELAKALFPNLDEMVSLHESITKDFKDRREEDPVISSVGDILLKRFDGEKGDVYRKGCAEYCRNQAHTLEALKKQTRKEAKLAQFLTDAESKPVCRRLHLRDLVPSQMQRLTKYPLLIENLMKYTPTAGEEYKRLQRASERCKHILSYVNQAIKECENYHKLKEIQKKLDKKSLEASTDPAMQDIKNLKLVDKKLIFDGPLTWKLKQNRTLDLHVLLLDDMLVLLQKQDDKYVLKYQNSNSSGMRDSTREDFKYTHSPVLKLRNLLARDVATDEKSFFVVNISEIRAQMYQLIASTKELREKWGRLINERALELKSLEAERPASNRPLSALPSRQIDRIEVDTAKISRHTLHSESAVPDKEDMDTIDGLTRLGGDDDEEEEEEGLVQPNEVCVSNVITAEATAIRTPLELLRHNSDVIATALEDRHRLLAQLLELPPPQQPLSSSSSLTATTSTTAASSSPQPPSPSLSSSLHPTTTTTSNQTPFVQMGAAISSSTTTSTTTINKRPPADGGQAQGNQQWVNDDTVGSKNTDKELGQNNNDERDGVDPGGTQDIVDVDGHHDDNNNLEETLLLRAVTKVQEFTLLVVQAQNESVSVVAQHQVQQEQQQQQQRLRRASADSGNTPLVSPTRRMSGLAQEMSSDIHSGQTPSSRPTVSSSSPSQSSSPSAAALSSKPPLPPLSPLSSSISSASSGTVTSPPPASGGDKGKVAMPLDELKEMMVEMNAIMSKLMSTVNNGREEKKRLHQELQEARAKMDALKERQKQMIISGAVPPDRFLGADDPDYIERQQQSPAYLSSPSTTTVQPPLSPSTLSSPPPSPSSPLLSSPHQQQEQQQQHHSLQTSILEEESSDCLSATEEALSSNQEVHHGIQEAVVMAESVETLDSAPSTQMATVVGDKKTGGDGDGNKVVSDINDNDGDVDKVIEIAMEDDDDDDIVNTNVSVADLPLPDMASVPPPSTSEAGGNIMVDSTSSVSVSEKGGVGVGLLDNVELEEMSDEDDSETVVGKGERSPNTSHDSVQALGGDDAERKIKVKGGENNEEEEEDEFDDAIEI